MSRFVLAMCLLFMSRPAFADTASEVMALYQRFATAQNAHNAQAISAELLQSPKFLWVSDGKTFWGSDTAVERMSMFQASEVWRVEPALDQAQIIEQGKDTALLHMPLELDLQRSECRRHTLQLMD